ncbi:MAG: MFS transporter [Candidatus Eisenbacteria bacterium]|nr:MFS transporter [Candidatus Eisenbacteria bacterium]
MSPVNCDPSGLRLIFRALRHKNYRLYFTGQSVSLMGTWMQRITVGWLVYRLTDSPFLLGVVGFAGQIPTFFMAPLAGALSDRWNRLRIIQVMQYLAMAQAAVLAVLVLTDVVTVTHVIVLSVVLAVVNGFDMPVRQAFTVEMVDRKEDLGNAIALNSSMFNAARLIGPSVAGILIATMGEGICFLVNALSYIPVIFALRAIKVPPRRRPHGQTHVLRDLKDGVSYAFGFTPIKYIILLLALISLVGMPYQVLMPVFARDVLHGGPHTLGFLVGASGVGAIIGAFYMAARKSVRGLGSMIPVMSGLFGVGLIAFSLSPNVWLSYFFVAVAGFGMIVHMASSNTVMQTVVDDGKRGRVMSFYTMSFMGMAPLGSLAAGSLAGTIGAPYTLAMGGALAVVGALLFARKLPEMGKAVLPIYAREGIIQEPGLGIQEGTQFNLPKRRG